MTALTRTIFDNTSLQAAIDHAAAQIPAGHDSAIVVHVDTEGAAVSVIVRAGEHWSVKAAAVKPWQGPLSAEADVIYSW